MRLNRKRVPRPLQPSGIQLRYYEQLRLMVRFMRSLVQERLIARLPDFVERIAPLHADSGVIEWFDRASVKGADGKILRVGDGWYELVVEGKRLARVSESYSELIEFAKGWGLSSVECVDMLYGQENLSPRNPPRVSGATSFLLRLDSYETRADAHPPGKRVNTIMQQASDAFDRKYPIKRLDRLAKQMAEATDKHQKAQMGRQLTAQLGVNIESIVTKKVNASIKLFVAENVALIKTVPQKYFSEVESTVLQGMRSGLRAEEIADAVRERGDVAQSRAKLIARDQVLKFNGDLSRVRQQDLGINSYTWRTVEDERVRSAHAERDGQVYAWDDPPGDPEDPAIGGHPGVAINCRCWADPNVEEVLEGAEDAEGD